MNNTNLLEDQPIAWAPTPDVIERAQLTKFMSQVGVSTWDELYEFSIHDVEKFTEEVLKFLEMKLDPPYEKLLDITSGVEFPTWLSGAGLGGTPDSSVGPTKLPFSHPGMTIPRPSTTTRAPSAAPFSIHCSIRLLL
jgi:hypothetical protein